MADHITKTHWCTLVRRNAIRVNSQGRDATRIEHPCYSSIGSGTKQIDRSGYIGPIEFRRVRRPQAIVSRNMKKVIASLNRRTKRCRVVQIAFSDLTFQAFKIATVTLRPGQNADVLALR
jgi:hypothetical protein